MQALTCPPRLPHTHTTRILMWPNGGKCGIQKWTYATCSLDIHPQTGMRLSLHCTAPIPPHHTGQKKCSVLCASRTLGNLTEPSSIYALLSSSFPYIGHYGYITGPRAPFTRLRDHYSKGKSMETASRIPLKRRRPPHWDRTPGLP